jgi:hypothetical protein
MVYFMEQRSIAFYLSMKGLTATTMSQNLVQILSAEVAAYPTATRHHRAAKFPAQNKETPDEAGVTRTDSINAVILKALINNPFSSMRKLSRPVFLSRSTVHRRLAESLGFTIRHRHRIRNRLPRDQSQPISRAPASAAKAANPRVAQYLDSG